MNLTTPLKTRLGDASCLPFRRR